MPSKLMNIFFQKRIHLGNNITHILYSHSIIPAFQKI